MGKSALVFLRATSVISWQGAPFLHRSSFSGPTGYRMLYCFFFGAEIFRTQFYTGIILFKWFELKPQPISWIYGIKLEMTYSEEALTKRSMCFGCSPCEI